MRIIDRYLLALLGLLAIVALVVFLPHAGGEPEARRSLHALPWQLDGWTAVEGTPEEVLPSDPRALETVRRTYSKGSRSVWVSVARYRSWNDPRWRPSINLIGPERGTISVEHDFLRVHLDGTAEPTIPMKLVTVRHPERQIVIAYWYQLGQTMIVDGYHLRLALFMNTLLLRRQDLFLVRVATTEREGQEEFLRGVHLQLVKGLSP